MRKLAIIILSMTAIVCIGIALYYPISYTLQEKQIDQAIEELKNLKPQAAATVENQALTSYTTTNPNKMDQLEANDASAILNAGQTTQDIQATKEPVNTEATIDPLDTTAGRSAIPSPIAVPQDTNDPKQDIAAISAVNDLPAATTAPASASPAVPTQTPEPTILEECNELLALNSDYIGWLTIDNTNIDYPVLQTDNEEYYLTHDFYGEENNNGQLVLDSGCDIKEPSFHLVISGHNMKTGKMFASLLKYDSKWYWKNNQILEFNSIYRHGRYVIFAAFYAKNYDQDEEGFRYNVDISHAYELNAYLDEIDKVKQYDTGINVKYGDELITLSTCDNTTKNGRFVVVARKIREGEVFSDEN
ncbi:MAG: class B sortase [Clostridiales bacterium]|nr:class B sortase [Clostridiales bacterium]